MKVLRNFGLLVSFLSLCAPALSQELLIEWAATSQLGQGDITLKAVQGTHTGSFQTPLMKKNNRGFIERVKLPSGANAQQAIDAYRKVPGVLRAEVNQEYQALDTSNDDLYVNGSLWGMYSSDSPNAGPTNTTNQYGSQAEQAWNQGKLGSMRTVIGVIDTGVDYTHPDLYLNIYLNQGEIKNLSFYNSLTDVDGDGLITFRDLNNPANAAYVSDINGNSRIDAGDLLADSRWANGVDDDNNGYVDDLIGWDFVNNDNNPMDDNRHGTHVSGTIGGLGNNTIGVAGVNWKVQIMPLKFLNAGGSGYTSDAIKAIDYYTAATQAQDKAYNPNSPDVFIGTSNSWGGGGYSDLMRISIENGAKVNNHFIAAAGNSSVNTDSSPFYPANYSTLAGAGWEAVTAVASLDSTGALSSFSNYGSTTVDIGAPGSGIQSTTPNNTYSSLSGTSMATPHVSGSLALFASSYPQATRREIRDVLLSTATTTTSLTGKVVSNGRLNIQSALAELQNRYPGVTPTYSLSSPTSVNEGVTLTVNISTANVASGTTLYWSITGIQLADTSLSSLQGSASVSNNAASVAIPIRSDNSLEGTETLTFNLYTDSGRTQLVASRNVSIADTSTGLTYYWGTTGNNYLTGNAYANSMTGVPSSGTSTTALGRGQIDSVTTKGGADVIVLGQTREGVPRVFYDAGSASSTGSSDYLTLTDFNKTLDRLQLVPGRYFSQVSGFNTFIYWDRNNNGTLDLTGTSRDELIAVLKNVNLGNLTLTAGSVPWIIMIQ